MSVLGRPGLILSALTFKHILEKNVYAYRQYLFYLKFFEIVWGREVAKFAYAESSFVSWICLVLVGSANSLDDFPRGCHCPIGQYR